MIVETSLSVASLMIIFVDMMAKAKNVCREIGLASKLCLLFWLGYMPVVLSLPLGDIIFAQVACP